MITYSADIPSLTSDIVKSAIRAGIAAIDLPAYVADTLRQHLAGTAEYTRKRGLSPAARREEILARFNGRNGQQLASEYGVTLRRVQQLVSLK